MGAGPFEQKPMRAFYYLTAATLMAGDKRKSTCAIQLPDALGDPIHEVFPGHFLH